MEGATTGDVHYLRVGLNSVANLRSDLESVMRHLALATVDREEAAESREKYLTVFQQKLQKISNDVRELDVSLNSLNVPSNAYFPIGATGHLAQDPNPDKNVLYSKLVQSYSWLDQLKEYAGVGVGVLSLNSIKRTVYGSMLAKKSRRGLGSNSNPPPATVDAILMTVLRQFSEMTIHSISRPYGSNAVIQLVLGRILRAVVIFRGLMVESIVVRGFGESNFDEETGQLNPWKQSHFEVFQKVTENANAAMLHYYSPLMPELAVRSFMTWLHSYNTLFSDSCQRCGTHLMGLLPPTWRDFRDLKPYHDDCKPAW